MVKFCIRLFWILSGFFMLLGTTTLPAEAHSLSPASTKSEQRLLCGHLIVYLDGHNPATTKCADKKNSQGHIIPNLYTSDCSAKTLIIYADSNQSGWTICFYGSGWTNMSEYCGPAPVGCLWNWNDNASSFHTGCSNSNSFYADANGEGTQQKVGAYTSGNFDGNPLYNDSLSSVYVSPNGC